MPLSETFGTANISSNVAKCGRLKARAGVQAEMKYWAYLSAKLALAGFFLYRVGHSLPYLLPPPRMRSHTELIGYDLTYTFLMMGYTLLASGVIWVVIWDQRLRCRTCLRKLRMPVLTGSWTHILFGRPRTEYICPFGHGTLKVDELQITGHQAPDWQPHEDMWKELVSLDDSKK
jgi:hypothetical protein